MLRKTSLIYAYIARERPSAAAAFAIAAEESFHLLSLHAEIGPVVRFPSRHQGLRFWPITEFQNYLIYYLVTKDHVSIERVLDSRRDVRRLFRGRGR